MPQITERTFYPKLIELIKAYGGSGISEVKYNSEPDVVFELHDRRWILSLKIGESSPILKSAFIQYHRHKDESKIDHGLIFFLPEDIRKIKPNEAELSRAIDRSKSTCLLDTPDIKQELRSITFPQLLQKIDREISPALERRERKEYPLDTVIALLQAQVTEVMQDIRLTDREMMRVITDKNLLSGIGHLEEKESVDTARFLASYILLSQILFLRLYSRARPEILPRREKAVTHHWLRSAFKKVLEINYRPIFELDVLDSIPENYVRDTFDLIWGLEVERIRYELPGRLFHELMPHTIRKLLAAFYTRPQAADLLSRLAIQHGNDSIYDPACGSGTILVSAYRRKAELTSEEGNTTNPHKRFCEEEIFGSDIMPFAVHLTSANLASMEPGITLQRTQIIQGDSLKLAEGVTYDSGVQTSLFPHARKGYTMAGEEQEVELGKADVVLMNPPFTKVERGIRKFVDMERFGPVSGNEVGLWGHFIALSYEFLKNGGILGGVIPISILRGRESEKIRDVIFSKWTLLYVVKSTFNYGFSEWSEYRDVLLVARRGAPPKGHKVKFALVKKDLKKLTKQDISYIGNQLESSDSLRDEELDIESFPIEELRERFQNLMWFCGVVDMKHRDTLTSFISKFETVLQRPPTHYFREGYRPVPKGVSSFMFLTRELDPSRTEEAFLFFGHKDDEEDEVNAASLLGVDYQIEKSALETSLRTAVGLTTMNVTKKLDYIAKMPYHEFDRVLRASKFKKPKDFSFHDFWTNVRTELDSVRSNIVTVHRINPFSPNQHLISFFSNKPFSASNVLNIVQEIDVDRAKAFCVLTNSAIFLAQFFLLKEETTGRYINIRFYDFDEMDIFPPSDKVEKLAKVFDLYSNEKFPPLRDQLDQEFDLRYDSFWLKTRKGQNTLIDASDTVQPSMIRHRFDSDVCKALGVSDVDLVSVYQTIVKEMIITRGLTRD